MFFSNEMIEKAKTASSPEELLEMAKKSGIELSSADAEMYFNFLTTTNGSLSDEEVEQVTGGKGGAQVNQLPAPKYYMNQHLWYRFKDNDREFQVVGIGDYTPGDGYRYQIVFLDNNSTMYGYLEINENVYSKNTIML